MVEFRTRTALVYPSKADSNPALEPSSVFCKNASDLVATLAKASGVDSTTVAAAIVVRQHDLLRIDSAKAVKSMIDDTMHPPRDAFLYSPFGLLDLRPVYVLAMLLYNRQNFEKLTTGTCDLIRTGRVNELDSGACVSINGLM
ncbi:hypothetical protein BV898_15106 [Hypsibius exemplaris]|uniref:Uncharacterized protein n=1 Tax=Hypsibius exemplaris TaxID=2072580 RepID=A0A9X6N9U7_HYPEX|nr:hypothetical protein BV898_15106 [Hypsibius exemplaris]